MNKDEMDLKKQKLNTKIGNLTFYRNLDIYLSGAYALITASGVGELITNDFGLSEIYVPLILGSSVIMIRSFKMVKKTNYKLKKTKNELYMLEQHDDTYDKKRR